MTSERPDWLDREARRSAAHRQHSARRRGPRRVRTGFRRSVACAQGRGLAPRRALRLCRAARRDRACARGFRVPSSTSIAIRAAPRSIPVRRRRNCARPRPSTASRSIGRAERRTQREINERRRLFFDPYHAALSGEIARLRETFKRVALFDAHSIRSRIPRLFDGELPLFNLGTNSGSSCDPGLRDAVGAVLAASSGKHASSTGASRAAGSRAPTAIRTKASRPCRWNWPAEPT